MIELLPKTKPQLTVTEQIEHLKNKGVKFDLISEEEGAEYLSKNNNYFRICSYRKSFEKYSSGDKSGTYVDLDFAMLKDLSIIDMRLRSVLLLMSLDIEHFEKVKLLNFLSESSDSGYDIVREYFEYLKSDEEKYRSYSSLKSEIERNRESDYCGGVIKKYDGQYPVWAFLEIIPFGRFILFFRFCGEKFENKKILNDYYLLRDVKRLRNAAAHNNCIIYNLLPKTAKHKTNYNVNMFLSEKKFDISKSTRKQKMSNSAINDIVTLIYTYNKVVSSESVLDSKRTILKDVANRFYKNIRFYKNNDTILTTFDFLKKIIDNT